MRVRRNGSALELAAEIEDRSLEADSRLQSGLIALECDNVDAGRDDIAEAYTVFKDIRNWRGAAQALIGRAAAYRMCGDVESARTALRRGVGLASEMHDLWLQVEAQIEAAELEDQVGNLELATRIRANGSERYEGPWRSASCCSGGTHPGTAAPAARSKPRGDISSAK